MNQFSVFTHAAALLWEKPKQFLKFITIDCVFLLVLAFSSVRILDRLLDHLANLTILSDTLFQQAKKFTLQDFAEVSKMQSSFQQSYNQTLQLLAVLGAFVFVLWIIFQGWQWLQAVRMVEKKAIGKAVLLKFGSLSLLWFIASVLILVGYGFAAASAATGIRIVSQGWINYLMLLLFFLVCYLFWVGTSMLSQTMPFFQWIRCIFSKAVGRFTHYIVPFLVSILLAGAAIKIIKAFAVYSISLPVIVFAVILLPLVSVVRMINVLLEK